MTFNSWLSIYTQRIETILDEVLPKAQVVPTRLHQAMRYCVLSGGKRIRPLLVYAAGSLFQPSPRLQSGLDKAAAAVELIHAYSLVHDDLPAMDNAALRRGKPSCHSAFDEATAILVGDALQALAFELLLENLGEGQEKIQLQLLQGLVRAVGSRGLVGGQSLDLSPEIHALQPELEERYYLKTGILIETCVLLGAEAAGCTDERYLKILKSIGRGIGLLFQIKDDILDLEGETEIIGKQQGSDFANNKKTYPTCYGLEAAKLKINELYQEALEKLGPWGEKASLLKALCEWIVVRAY